MTDPDINSDNPIDPVMSDLSPEDQAQLFQLLKVEAGMTLTMRKNGAVADGVDVDIAQVCFNNMDESTKPLVVVYTIESGTAVFQENKLTTIRKNTNKSLSSTVQLINLTPGKGMIKATPFLNPKMAPPPVEYEFIGKPRKLRLVLTANPDNQISDGVATDGVTATLTDENNQPVGNEKLEFTLSGTAQFKGANLVTTDANGKASVLLTSNANANISVTVTCTVLSDTTVTQSVVVKFKARPRKLTLIVNPNNQFSDGIAANGVIATLMDENNKPVSNEQLEFKLNGNAQFRGSNLVTTDANGKATVFITSNANADIAVTINCTAISDRSVTQSIVINFKAKLSFKITLTKANDNARADGKDSVRITATLTDNFGRPVSDRTLYIMIPPESGGRLENGAPGAAIVTGSFGNLPGQFVFEVRNALRAGAVPITVSLSSDLSVTAMINANFIANPVTPPPPQPQPDKYVLTITPIADNTQTHTKTYGGGGNVASVRLTYGGRPVPNVNINCSLSGTGFISGISNNPSERAQQVSPQPTMSTPSVVMRTNGNGEFIVRMGMWNNLTYSTRETGTLYVSYNNITASRGFTWV